MKKLKLSKYLNVAIPVLVFLLLLQVLLFVSNTFSMVSETNKNNFAYVAKIRDTIEEIDKIIERAEVNLNLLADTVIITYDLSKVNDQNYNTAFIKRFNVLVKSVLINSPGVQGSWFQVNADLPFSSKMYCWYALRNNKIVNLNKNLDNKYVEERKVNPDDDKYYFEAVKTKKVTWSKIYKDYETNVEMVTISQPVYKNGKLIGVAGIDISVQNLQQALINMQSVFSGSEIFLLDEHNKIILKQLLEEEMNEKYPENDNTFADLIRAEKNNKLSMLEFMDNGIRKTAILFSLSNKYSVVVSFPNSMIYRGFDRLFETIYFIFAILFGLALVVYLNKYKIMKINKQLKTEAHKLRTIIDSSQNIVLLKHLDGVYADCNDRFLELVNMKRSDIIGKTDYEIFGKEKADEHTENDRIVRATQKTLVKEALYRRGDFKFYAELFIVPLFNPDKEMIGLLINAFDITKTKQEQVLLEQARDAAEKATAMKSNFLANMSHEIRTPLNGILGFLQLLKDSELDEEQMDFVDDAQKSSEILLEVINDILDFSKIEADKLQIDNVSFNIRSVIEDIVLMISPNATKKGLRLNSLICSDVPREVFGDPVRVKQILNNLVSNAVKFTNEGGVVINVTQIDESEDVSVLRFEVKDTGIGIEEDKLDLIFEEFTQADASMTRKFGGTGLGLAISRKLVFLMNGEIEVKSKVNKGSSFIFTLPFKMDQRKNQFMDKCANAISGSKILVVNSDPSDLYVVESYLSHLNCIIYNASSIQDAFEVLERSESNISVVLIDSSVEKEGEETFSSLLSKSEKYKDIPLILYNLSSSGEKSFDSSTKERISGFIEKPISKESLINTIAASLGCVDCVGFNCKNNGLKRSSLFKQGLKVLVVEDSEINCKLILKILQNQGISCDLALNGRDAVTAFKSKSYDLILMDCQMPILDGYEATKLIREIESDNSDSIRTPIIAMTANAMANDEQKCYEMGMDDYISKPINIDVLLNVLSKYLLAAAATPAFLDGNMNNDSIEMIIEEMSSELGFTKEESEQLLKEYLEFLPQIISKIEKVLLDSDFDELEKLAHSLKGSSANLRISEISKFAMSLEKEALSKNQETCIDIIANIKAYFGILVSKADKFYNLK